MRLPSLLLPLLAVGTVRSDGTINTICNGIRNVAGCTATIEVPTGAKSKMCRNKFFEADKCKTRKTYKYPCPTLRKPGRMCDGWTCVPGTNEKWIDVPCGITITTAKKDLCGVVRGAMGNAGQEVITKTTAICRCFPQVLSMVGNDLFKAVQEGADYSAATTAMIRAAVNHQKCIIDTGFSITDDKAGVMANTLASGGGWTVLTAVEVDVGLYAELATAISPCFIGGCDPNLIRSFFTSYLSRSQKLVGDRLIAVLRGWIDIFGNFEKRVANVGTAAKQLAATMQKIPGKIAEIEERICKDDTCLGPVISDFLRKVSNAVATVEAFEDIGAAANTIAKTVPQVIAITNSVVEAAKVTPDASYFIDLIRKGNFNGAKDLIAAFKVTTELPKLAANLQTSTSVIAEFFTKYSHGAGLDVATLLDDVLATAWDAHPLEFTGDPSGKVRAGLVEIQTLLRTEVRGSFRNVTNALADVQKVFDSFPARTGKLDLQMGVASYHRWSEVSMDMPCSRTGIQHYEVAGFRGSFSYPQFYSCRYGPQRIPWPNHHIPYIKFRVQ